MKLSRNDASFTGANQNPRKLLSTDLVNTKYIYIYIYIYIYTDMYVCILFSNLQIVVALLFGCSVTKPTGCKDDLLISYERMNCPLQYGSEMRVDRYVQIQCDGQSCNATCDGGTSENNHTSKFVEVKTQSKPAWQLFLFLPKRILCIEFRDDET